MSELSRHRNWENLVTVRNGLKAITSRTRQKAWTAVLAETPKPVRTELFDTLRMAAQTAALAGIGPHM